MSQSFALFLYLSLGWGGPHLLVAGDPGGKAASNIIIILYFKLFYYDFCVFFFTLAVPMREVSCEGYISRIWEPPFPRAWYLRSLPKVRAK